MSMKKAAMDSSKGEALDIAKDVLDGKADYWGLDYFKPNGRKTKFDEENAIVAEKSDNVIRIFRHPNQKEIIGFKKRN